MSQITQKAREIATPSKAAREAASAFIRGSGPWKPEDVNLPDDDYAVQAFARFERQTLEALRTNHCLNCETQANTIEELRAANERWVIAFKQAEERANGRIEALQAENAKLREALFPFAEFHQLGGSMNDPISMWFRVAPFADAAYALQETER